MSTLDLASAIARVKMLPTLPTVLSQILATVADPDASVVELSRHIAGDQSLTASLLKLVNSAYYGHYRQVDSITTAIVMLGFKEIRNLTLAATAFRNIPAGSRDFDRLQLWRHSLATAMAAERLSRVSGYSSDGCFIGGLLHDIGKVVFDTLYPGSFLFAIEQARIDKVFLREKELEVFGVDHAFVGGLLGEHWELPPTLVEAIRCHHRPEDAHEDLVLTTLVSIANVVATEAGFGETSNGCGPVLPVRPSFVNLTDDQCAEVAHDLHRNQVMIDEFLGALPVS